MRLDKFLADMSFGTRKEVKQLIKEKRVQINGKIVTKADFKVDFEDEVYVDDERIEYVEYEYLILNKPQDYVCALEDRRYPVIMELIESIRKDLVPVGRLDVDTEGLILITNDGQLNHKLLAPKSHVDKTYYVEVDNPIPENAVEIFSKPMDLDDFITQPAKLEILDETSANLTISEGKFHQVKRMFEKVGCTVTYLRRDQFGPLELGDLDIGEYRELSPEEVEALKNC
ncbi:MAG: rRNA pseudouridine synthase [Firmicutes bacterium]|nr:rRNA pseudouridine synthase [Bacillota bacterium]